MAIFSGVLSTLGGQNVTRVGLSFTFSPPHSFVMPGGEIGPLSGYAPSTGGGGGTPPTTGLLWPRTRT